MCRERGFYHVKHRLNEWVIGEYLGENGWIIHNVDYLIVRNIYDFDLIEINENKIEINPPLLRLIFNN